MKIHNLHVCYNPFHNSTLKCVLQQTCLLLISSLEKPSKLLTISPMSLLTTWIKKALTAHTTAKHSQIYCLITSKCLQQKDCGPFPQLVLWELTFSDSLWIWSISMELFILCPDLGGHCQFSWVAVFHLVLPVSRCLPFPQKIIIITKGFQDESNFVSPPWQSKTLLRGQRPPDPLILWGKQLFFKLCSLYIPSLSSHCCISLSCFGTCSHVQVLI